MRRTIIITDVTEMHGDQRCVAGWDVERGSMVRPLPALGSNWPAANISPQKLWPGNSFSFNEAASKATGEYPHATEDTLISTEGMTISVPDSQAAWAKRIAESASPTVSAAFAGNLVWREYDGERYHAVVPRGAKGPSLGATVVGSGGLAFIVDDRGKLRALLTDSDGTYKLPVVGYEINAAYRSLGPKSLASAFSKGKLHVRLGLARAYPSYPDECFAMLNGAYSC